MSSFDLSLSREPSVQPDVEVPVRSSLSRWSQSSAKRLFDLSCILCALPILLPLVILTSIAVRLTSRGSVLFRQQRIGRFGHPFTIYKFRTMPVANHAKGRPLVTTSVNQQFTPIGQFLRRWKLDELPQFINVLRGDMSLVGPRPKLATHQIAVPNCRPGITGRATLVFAREEDALAAIPAASLESFYGSVILPMKQALDDEYMGMATLGTDLTLLYGSVFRKEDDSDLTQVLNSHAEVMWLSGVVADTTDPNAPQRA